MIVNLIYFISIIFCFLTAALICFKINTNKLFSPYLLSAYLFLIGLANAFYLLIAHGYLIYIPYLYKIPAPLTFLIPPLAFLYLRTTLFSEKTFKKSDFIHFIPFIVFTINYLPFYFMPLAEKEILVARVVEDISLTYLNQDGIMPEWLNVVSRAVSSLVYLAAQWWLIKSFYKKNTKINAHFIKVKTWVFSFFRLQFFYCLGITTIYFIYGLDIANVSEIGSFLSNVTSILVSIFFFGLSGVLLLSPNALLGLNDPLSNGDSKENNSNYDTSLFSKLDESIRKQQVYINPNLNLGIVASFVGISQRNISIAVSDNGFENFNDYINSIRIESVHEKLRSNEIKNYSIEAIGLSCGFNSKATFYRAFKKTYKLTPKEFIQTLGQQEPLFEN